MYKCVCANATFLTLNFLIFFFKLNLINSWIKHHLNDASSSPRTLFKFIKKFQEVLSGPSAPSLVEQGSSASFDTVDTNAEETPVHRVHRALKSALPGRDRDLQVGCGKNFNKLIF